MGIFDECKKSPTGKHQWTSDADHRPHQVFWCHWCGKIKKHKAF